MCKGSARGNFGVHYLEFGEQNKMSEEKSQQITSETVPNGATNSCDAVPPEHSVPPPVAKPKYRHDWYQTESDVCINILIKKVKKENVQVTFQEKMVGIAFASTSYSDDT